MFDFDSDEEAKEIHDIAGGRPYEIQLICHVMFRRVQTGRAKMMRLNYQVLEEVRGELETSQDLTGRPVLARLRSLPRERLRVLPILCACNGRAGLDEIWPVFYATAKKTARTKEELSRLLDELTQQRLLSQENGMISFLGDEFEKVYARYYCREVGVRVDLTERDLTSYAIDRLAMSLLAEGVEPLIYLNAAAGPERYSTLFRALSNAEQAADIAKEPGLVKDLYLQLLQLGDEEKFTVIDFTLSSSSLFVGTSCLVARSQRGVLDNVTQYLNGVMQRATEAGLTSTLDQIEVPHISMADLISRLRVPEARTLRMEMMTEHSRMSAANYIDDNDIDAALKVELAAERLGDDLSTDTMNNIGYMLFIKGELERAKSYLERAAALNGPDSYPLAIYHLAMLQVKWGNLSEALALLDRCEQSTSHARDGMLAICLLAPKRTDEGFTLEEKREEIDLLTAAAQAKALLGEQLRLPNT